MQPINLTLLLFEDKQGYSCRTFTPITQLTQLTKRLQHRAKKEISKREKDLKKSPRPSLSLALSICQHTASIICFLEILPRNLEVPVTTIPLKSFQNLISLRHLKQDK